MSFKVLHTFLILLVAVSTTWLPKSATAAGALDILSPPLAEQPTNGAEDNLTVWTRWHPDQYTLAEDSESLWIGAAGGVIRWKKANQSYRRYSKLDGLPQQNIYTIAVDGRAIGGLAGMVG